MLRVIRFIAGIFLLAATAWTAGRAQTDETNAVSANLVSANVTVTDARGRHVAGLVGDQFEVFDNGVRGGSIPALGVTVSLPPLGENV